MTKKKLFLLIFIVIVLAASVHMFFLLKEEKKKLPINVKTNNNTEKITEFPIPSVSDEKMKIKTKEGGFEEINNLYKNPVKEIPLTETFSVKEIVIEDNSDYFIAYYPQDQGILITLLNPDIYKARKEAEKKLLEKLGISAESACKLKVDLSVPHTVSEKTKVINYGLSFCPDGIPFDK